jgi:hypothetical protein
VTRLVVTGVASDLCIVMSAAEARMRDYEVIVPGDCVAALTAARNAHALRYLEESHRIRTTASPRLRLPRAARASRRLASTNREIRASRAIRIRTRRIARRPRATRTAARPGFSPGDHRGRRRPPLRRTPAFQPESPQGSTIGVAR